MPKFRGKVSFGLMTTEIRASMRFTADTATRAMGFVSRGVAASGILMLSGSLRPVLLIFIFRL